MRASRVSPPLSFCMAGLWLLLASSPRICLMSSCHGVVFCALPPGGEAGCCPPAVSPPVSPFLAWALAFRARVPRSTASLSAVRIASWSWPWGPSHLM
eukprot:4340375-Pyramimonas_sp.AAC.1